jgi:filamentous hemagglutinin family protein
MTIRFANRLRADLKSSASLDWSRLAVSGAGVLFALPLMASPALANPLSGVATTGSVSIANTSNKTQIDQKSEDVVIDWSSFNIGAGQTTTFVQPNAEAIAVNRIGGNSASQILGTLDANGRIVLINGNGMLFGKDSQVNVGSLVATSTGGSDSDVLSGKFTQAGNQNATVVNQGHIAASQGGLVALVAPSVTNAGTVRAKFGTVALGAANAFTVDFAGDGLVSFAAQGDVNGSASAINTGVLKGAKISLTARAAEGVATGVVSMSGIAIAQTATNTGGTITLDAGIGGNTIASNAKLYATGANGGGSISLGGWNENSATVDQASALNASALSNGNGGTISVIATNTSFESAASSRGGASGGNGGTIETSGHVVDAQNARINASAAHGTFGTWSLDPYNVTISSATTTNGSLSGGIFTPTGNDSILNVKTLETALNHAGVDVTTGSGGSQAGDITIVSKLTWKGHSTLTLDAYHSVLVDHTITVTGTGGLDIVTNDGGTGGTFGFGGKADNVVFDDLSSALTINGNAYKLVGNIAALASDIAAHPAGNFALANSYNASGDGTYTSAPIATTFEGHFEGLGNTISGLSIDDTTSQSVVGLFADIGSNGSAENIGLTKVNIIGGGDGDTGALAGIDAGSIAAIYSTGRVEGGEVAYVGGIVGLLDGGEVANSSSGAEVVGHGSLDTNQGQGASAGGLVGMMSGSSVISNSSATGKVETGSYGIAGGLVGGMGTGSEVVDSNASGTVAGTAKSYASGGLVGSMAFTTDVEILNSYAIGNVTGFYAGGLIGQAAGTVENSYATGNVTGLYQVGGLAGIGYGAISDCHATGTASSTVNTSVGGLVGYLDSSPIGSGGNATVEDSYATGNVTALNSTSVGGLVGATFGTGVSIDGSHASGNVSGIDTGGLVGNTNAPITNSYATGTVAGGMSYGDYAGGLVSRGSNVSNSYATGNVSGYAAGGLAGGADITDSYATGAVTGVIAGGLAGESGDISQSYATGSVTGVATVQEDYVGGLVGKNSGDISNSYATGAVTGATNSAVGGLIGFNNESDQTVSYSYATGAVTGGTGSATGGLVGLDENEGGFTDNYWDTTTSGINYGLGKSGSEPGITGLTTAQLQSGLPSGFDPSIWGESESINGGLPYLLALPPT